MKYSELQQKQLTDLKKLLAEKRAELQTLHFKVANDQSKDVRKVRALRKEVAQILTAMHSHTYVTNE